MPYKDILVYNDASKTAPACLDLAAALAGAHDAHLTALHVTPPPFMPGDVVDIPRRIIEQEEEAARARAETAKAEAAAAQKRSGRDIECRVVKGPLLATALLHSRYADLVVVSQAGAEPDEPVATEDLPEAIVMGAGRPVIVVPRYGKFPRLGENVLVAWNRTREAARAVHDALPLLARAAKVTIMEVNPERGESRHIPGVDVATHLARHGVKAEATSMTAEDLEVGDSILSRITDLGVDCLVMGAYGHSRLREFVLGGVTRHLLKSMTVPVFMSH